MTIDFSRRTFLAAGAAAAGVVLAGCSGTAGAGKAGAGKGALMTLACENSRTFTRNFNPFSPTSRWASTKAMYEPLMIQNFATGKLEPSLATAYTWSNGGRRLELKLRDGVKWSDGTPFTAADVVFTFELMKANPGLIGPASGVWHDFLAAVSAPDPGTVRFDFRKVYSPGLYLLAGQFVVGKQAWSAVTDPVKYTNENPVATGPFTTVSVFGAQQYQLTQNPHYWQKLNIRGLNVPAYSGNDQIAAALVSGQLDWGGTAVDPDKTFVPKDPQHFGYWWPLTSTVFLAMNTTKKPFDDVRVRKAISLALDRQRMIQVALWGKSEPGNASGLAEGAFTAWIDPAVVASGKSWVDHDPAAAAAQLDAAGIKLVNGKRVGPDGKPLQFTIEVPTGWTDWIASSQVVSQSMNAIGITVDLRTPAVETWTDNTQNGRFDLTLTNNDLSATPFEFFRAMMSSQTYAPVGTPSAQNLQRFKDPRADALLDKFAATSDQQAQKGFARQLQALFSEDAPAVPLYGQPSWGTYNTKRFSGLPSSKDQYAPLNNQGAGTTYLIWPKLTYTA
ncbi:ABC transporter substrate-binding protein [Kribbella sp. NPDC059898]|uniref:ABC transporter substrate-binding protein n=1 Tax=Kribbella sp. NPDC059898 TaxID=3346995 RepID=UPI0036696485